MSAKHIPRIHNVIMHRFLYLCVNIFLYVCRYAVYTLPTEEGQTARVAGSADPKTPQTSFVGFGVVDRPRLRWTAKSTGERLGLKKTSFLIQNLLDAF